MALLKFKDIKKMNPQEIESRLQELRFSLARNYVTANKSAGKSKEIKKAIARLLTHRRIHKEVIRK